MLEYLFTYLKYTIFVFLQTFFAFFCLLPKIFLLKHFIVSPLFIAKLLSPKCIETETIQVRRAINVLHLLQGSFSGVCNHLEVNKLHLPLPALQLQTNALHCNQSRAMFRNVLYPLSINDLQNSSRKRKQNPKRGT